MNLYIESSSAFKTADGKQPLVMLTRGICADVPQNIVRELLNIAFQNLNSKVDFIVFCPNAPKDSIADEGRTYRHPLREITGIIKETMYAILDDYGSVEALRQSSGIKNLQTQFVLTLLFAHEY